MNVQKSQQQLFRSSMAERSLYNAVVVSCSLANDVHYFGYLPKSPIPIPKDIVKVFYIERTLPTLMSSIQYRRLQGVLECPVCSLLNHLHF